MIHNVHITHLATPLRMVFTGCAIILSDATVDAIDNHWQTLLDAGKKYQRGDVLAIQNIELDDTGTTMSVGLTDYAHYLATAADRPVCADTPCRVLHTSVLIESSDNQLIFGEMATHTATPHRLQCAGGGITLDDLRPDQTFDIAKNAREELLEETGIDITHADHATTMDLVYLKSGGAHDFVGAMFVARSALQTRDIMAIFTRHQSDLAANGQACEFSCLLSVANDPDSITAFLAANKMELVEYLPALLHTHATSAKKINPVSA